MSSKRSKAQKAHISQLAASIKIFIPVTNDANEGALSSWRVWLWYHPSSTAAGFSNKVCLEWNNTESFIEKHCNEADHKYVMRTVRAQGASGENSRFHQELLEAQCEHIHAYWQKQQEAEAKKQREKERLITLWNEIDVQALMQLILNSNQQQIIPEENIPLPEGATDFVEAEIEEQDELDIDEEEFY
ncbi:hypothetical protein CPB84DRAFT_1846117 [Gymnopilus junonius]|uniref:Uncharacterized protein n=1 Tax=Gymnopilus junonius TaxID=109634 RepID=A0A9P5NN49_GYMJU|nr:hypothetical protein CPB84DRAFT_1846117 [Gymnopilus junonius]